MLTLTNHAIQRRGPVEAATSGADLVDLWDVWTGMVSFIFVLSVLVSVGHPGLWRRPLSPSMA